MANMSVIYIINISDFGFALPISFPFSRKVGRQCSGREVCVCLHQTCIKFLQFSQIFIMLRNQFKNIFTSNSPFNYINFLKYISRPNSQCYCTTLLSHVYQNHWFCQKLQLNRPPTNTFPKFVYITRLRRLNRCHICHLKGVYQFQWCSQHGVGLLPTGIPCLVDK